MVEPKKTISLAIGYARIYASGETYFKNRAGYTIRTHNYGSFENAVAQVKQED
jgi:hypothetical protein